MTDTQSTPADRLDRLTNLNAEAHARLTLGSAALGLADQSVNGTHDTLLPPGEVT